MRQILNRDFDFGQPCALLFNSKLNQVSELKVVQACKAGGKRGSRKALAAGQDHVREAASHSLLLDSNFLDFLKQMPITGGDVRARIRQELRERVGMQIV
jgi:hypothetical protein